ncbi:MAG: IS3 family transposase [Nannocystaceae bacterium]
MKLEHAEAASEEFPVAVVCDALEISRSAFYESRARARRGPSARELDRRRLRHAIATTFKENRGAYGRPRMRRALAAKGIQVSVNRLRHEMASMGLYGKLRRSFRKTTLSEHGEAIAKNLLKQKFQADAPDRIWCGDISVPQKAAREMRDRPLAIGLQEQVANHRMRLGSKALVVSVAEEAP